MTTIPERIREEAWQIILRRKAATDGLWVDDISAAIFNAERRGREEERERAEAAINDELVTIYEDSPDIDIECNNLCRRLLAAIRSTN